MQGQMVDGCSLLKSSPLNSQTDSGTLRSMDANLQPNTSKGDLSLYDSNSLANSCNMVSGDGANPYAQNNRLLNQWKHTSHSTNFQGSEDLGRMRDQVHDQNQGSWKSSDNDETTNYYGDNCAMKDNSNNSHRSNVSSHAPRVFREGRTVDAIDSRALPSGGGYSGYASCTSNLFSRSLDSSMNKASQPSQNMLELLHKVDQSRDHDSLTHSSSSERNVSSQHHEAENSDGSVGRLQCSRSSLSQGFGLQLGPPSQLLQTPDLSSASQNAQNLLNATHNSCAGTRMGEKSMLIASSLQPRQFSNEKIWVEYENDSSTSSRHYENDNSVSKVSGNYHSTFTSDTPYVQRQFQNNEATRLSTRAALNRQIDSLEKGPAETVLPDASSNIPKNNPPSQGTAQQSGPYDVHNRGPAVSASSQDQLRGSKHFGLPGISRQGSSSQFLHNMWTNVPTPQRNSVAHYPKGPLHFHEPPHPNILESSSHGDFDVSKVGHISSMSASIHADSPVRIDGEEHRLEASTSKLASVSKVEESLGCASSIKNHLDESPANSASTRKDIEDFGRSLKPNTFSNENFALLNQMRTLKNAESDPSITFSKRTKGPKNMHDIRQEHVMAEKQSQYNFRNSLGSINGVPPDDSGVLSLSSPSDMLLGNSLAHENADPEDVAATAVEVHQLTGSLKSSAPAVEANEHLSSQSMPVYVANQHQLILKPKKRRTATSELLSWYKGISHCAQSSSVPRHVVKGKLSDLPRFAKLIEDMLVKSTKLENDFLRLLGSYI